MTGTCQHTDLNDKSAILCVPTTLIAEEIIITMQKLSVMNLEFDKFENLLLLAKETEVPSDIRKFSLEKNLDQYCNTLLFWKSFVNQTINVLRKYNHQYEYHLNVNPKLRFLDCFKRKFSAAFEDVSNCLRFILRLPRDSFDTVDFEANFEAINASIEQLEEFHASLMSEEIEEDVLESVLNLRGATKGSILHNHGFELAQKLNEKRVGCIVALEILKSSLKLKKFVTRAEVTKYLMMKSKLMIYFPSSSYFNNILSASEKIFDLFIVSDALLNANNIALVGDTCQLQKHEIDMNKHGHVLFEALLSMGLKTHKPSWSEIPWIGIPKNLLATVRDQGNTETCAFHSSLATTQTHYKFEAHSDTPPRTFSVTLCEKDMGQQYEKVIGTRLGHEKKTTECQERRTRLENSFLVLEKVGVQGYIPRNKSKDEKEKVPVAFRIASYKKYSTSDLASVCSLIRDNKVMAGYFRLSRSYFTLRPGQTYKYDPQQPILNKNAKLVCSHAVMFVGVLRTKVPNMRSSEYKGEEKKKIIKLAYQNSYGKLFGGNNGFSIIDASSVINFFLPIL